MFVIQVHSFLDKLLLLKGLTNESMDAIDIIHAFVS